MKDTLLDIVRRHREAVDRSFGNGQMETLETAAREILKALKAGNKVLLCGNGGSAADCQHIAAEFVGRYKRERQSLAAIALTTDTSILTAVGNDYCYEDIFARQIQGLAQKGDVLIALSTSGNSKNVLRAVAQAKEQGLLSVGFSGGNGGTLQEVADICYIAGSNDTANIQEMHMTCLHAISELVEDVLFGA